MRTRPRPREASLGTGSRRYGQVHAYSPYLHRRWNEGCTDAARLHAEIVELGFTGSKRTVRRHLQEIRASGNPAPDKPKVLTVRTATWLITSHRDYLEESGTLKLKKLLSCCPELVAVAACVRSFAAMMTARRGGDLEIWLSSAEDTGMKPLRTLACGLRQDFDAVTAGLTLEWNSGKVEGNVNRAKRIKRADMVAPDSTSSADRYSSPTEDRHPRHPTRSGSEPKGFPTDGQVSSWTWTDAGQRSWPV
ncbi:transposase [Streptomyces sp. NPDC088124]|uniref:transposase n=1 Tax=Streptomyces sp. NPDC088124 TaxID=3154654 RepID=UPI003431291B